jgi:Orthopoxvirus protein of unknown function (DUF830).
MPDSPEIPQIAYQDVRPLIRSGDLLLCSGSSSFSRMIQAATNSHYSHVAFLWRMEGLERILVVESVESIGVRAVPLSSYLIDYSHSGQPYPGQLYLARHRAFPEDAPPRVLFGQQAVDLLGTAYDNRAIADIALRIVAAKLGIAPRVVTPKAPLICSEFIKLLLDGIGLSVPFDKRGFIAPKDFAAAKDIDLLWEIG